KINLPNSSNKGFDVKLGMIDSNPNSPYNQMQSYESKYSSKRVAVACIVDYPFEIISNQDPKIPKNNTESETNIININMESSTNNKPFAYQDSNIQAHEIINQDNTSTLVIESKNNFLEYQGNTADTLMSGLSGIFGGMVEGAKQASKQAVKQSMIMAINA
ncbi:hypothetical protein, partial [Helicobacter sp. MIT 05-5294]|uniref:hypothetical protein n=1 Tax=Helicobacter sp. MIT 05-5294 TaxID=1548150 RepID=UPI00188372F9